ncbi:sulfurtransferase complex subunit TusB [Marinobacter sp.]|uniref:sulfurtransferase complex subunit TusB n=1 Tax=Marinobacter sp. TaxID=50741 RepID=UPI0035613396
MTNNHHNSGTLHILNKAPEHPRFAACLEALSPSDTLVLIENAVLACASVPLPDQSLALTADIKARGLTASCEGIQTIGYGDLVQLTETHTKIISW